MAVRAFFLINIVPTTTSTKPVDELKAVPGIIRIDEVSGAYDYIVEVETPYRISTVSDIIMAKPWVRRLHVLRPLDTGVPSLPPR